MTSQYLLKSPRTLRQACRDICLAHPDLPAKDCQACILADLCVINQELETINVAAEDEPPGARFGRYRTSRLSTSANKTRAIARHIYRPR